MSVEVQRETQAVYPEIQAIRHKLHQCPELGHREVETTRLIRACLEEYGAEVLDYVQYRRNTGRRCWTMASPPG